MRKALLFTSVALCLSWASYALAFDDPYGVRLFSTIVTFNQGFFLPDDDLARFGNTAAAPDYWCEWDTTATPDEWACTSTDVDGIGTDGVVWSVDTGTDDIAFVGSIQGTNANGPYIENAASSATNPTLVPDRASATAGIGGTGGDVSIITSGAERINVDTAGAITLATVVQITGTNSFLGIGTTSADGLEIWWNTTQTPDAITATLDGASRSLIVCEEGDQTTDFAHANPTNPTIFVQSADQTTVADYLSLAHNQTDAIIGSGAGDLGIADDGGKGVVTYIRTNTEVLTFAADPGDATKVTSALCPVGRPIMGITTRVRTTATNCTSVQIGDGTDADMFSSATSAVAAGTTTDADDYTAYTRIGIGQAAFNVTITANGGNCFAGVFAVTCHYIDPAAATAN